MNSNNISFLCTDTNETMTIVEPAWKYLNCSYPFGRQLDDYHGNSGRSSILRNKSKKLYFCQNLVLLSSGIEFLHRCKDKTHVAKSLS